MVGIFYCADTKTWEKPMYVKAYNESYFTFIDNSPNNDSDTEFDTLVCKKAGTYHFTSYGQGYYCNLKKNGVKVSSVFTLEEGDQLTACARDIEYTRSFTILISYLY